MKKRFLASLKNIGRSLPRHPFNRKKAEARPGLPEEADTEQISSIIGRVLGAAPLRICHQKLSSWKRTGAYRLLIAAEDGRSLSLVYKDADYSIENIPALRGLPEAPGHPEYIIYSSGDGDLRRYLPQVHWHEETTPGLHYRYVLEDLSLTCRRSSEPESIVRYAEQLPELHRVLKEWHSRCGKPGLLRYGPGFSRALQTYVRNNLATFSEWSGEETAVEFERLWPDISRLHGSLFSGMALEPIHGDFNPSNIWSANNGALRIVDWEWAGLGIPHQDLAALLKRLPGDFEERALAAYCRKDDRLSAAEHRRLYDGCLLERAMIDAAFLSVQLMQGGWKTRMDQRSYIRSSLASGLAAFHRLAGDRSVQPGK